MPLLATDTVGLLGLLLALVIAACLPAALAIFSCVTRKKASRGAWAFSGTSVVLGALFVWVAVDQRAGLGVFAVAFCLPLMTGITGVFVCMRSY